MIFLKPKITSNIPSLYIQKKIKIVLKELSFWFNLALKLSHKKEKCSSYYSITNYKLYIKKKKYEFSIKSKEYSNKFNKCCICDEYIYYKKRYQYIQKKIIFDIKNIQVKNLIKNLTKYH